ncbi:DUF4349 domain-containing protein [Labedella phragmitis]|uniref:DUF4349 domain-containing protein n=1 Tax=Labedella phragmitis TaxID=2498849 RepID=UPI00140D93B3|nr:DUF4349 domain-containing protein [Labedella phragmitis]
MTAFLLASCSSSGGSATDESGGGPVPEPGRVLPGEPFPNDSEPDVGAGGSDDGTDADREVVVTAWVSLSHADPIEVADEIEEIADAADGRVDQRTDSPAGAADPASASLVLRIPTNDLDGVMDEIAEAATVVSSALDRRDVTSSVTDITARIGALEASIDRLLELLDGATSTSDLISIESELTTRQAERDSLVAQQQSLVEQVAFSTVSVDIGVPEEVGGAGPGDFWGGLVLGFRSLGAFLGGALVVVGVLVPWLLLAAAVSALVWWLRRRRRGHGPRPSPRSGRPVPPSDPDTAASSRPGAAVGFDASWPTDAQQTVPPRPPLPATAPGEAASSHQSPASTPSAAPAGTGASNAAPPFGESAPASAPATAVTPQAEADADAGIGLGIDAGIDSGVDASAPPATQTSSKPPRAKTPRATTSRTSAAKPRTTKSTASRSTASKATAAENPPTPKDET